MLSSTLYDGTNFVINNSSQLFDTMNKAALRWVSGTSIDVWLNGVIVYTYTGTIPVFTTGSLTNLRQGDRQGNFPFKGRTKTVAVFKEALSDTELACLTSTNNREIFLNYYYRMQYVGANTEALSCAEQTFNV